MKDQILQFQPQSSAVEAAFWHDLGEKKIEIFKLDDKAKQIVAYYSTGTQEEIPSRLCLGAHALSSSKVPPFSFPSPGLLRNTNTLEDFKELDKNKEFSDISQQIWNDIVSGDAVKRPSLLTRFLLITFADLKKYKYRYWFAFPALNPSVPFKALACKRVDEVLSSAQIDSLRKGYEAFRGLPEAIDLDDKGFFLLDYSSSSDVSIGKLTDWDNFHKNGEIRVGFADPSALPSNPGWYLRNFLVLLKKHWGVSKVKVFCYRELAGKGDISKTIVIDVDLSESDFSGSECPKAVGWEKNGQGKLAPREVDLAPLMDPLRLASTAVDLNLKLMRWRLLPSLDLEKISSTKCLLFGAGTLGCNVARCLLGWGVRNLTLVDNGKVSFSNPVRQSLFFYDDCLEGGKPKAPAAAEALKRIFPGVTTQGYDISVPMPGHSVSPSLVEQVKKDVELIEQLIKSHDAVFLLMDTRESRWLPSMLCAYYNKITINTALGFDTYLVMRHGVRPKRHSPQKSTAPNQTPEHLGCYFCNDVVAPTDSMKDRTLDQQCTVTRPGLSYIASALAVELMVSMTQHAEGPWAPASSSVPTSQAIQHDLGLIPHQIRGFLTHFANMIITGAHYDKCTACSEMILNEYKNNGFEFLLKAFNDPSYLEQLTGLDKLHAEAEEASCQWGVEADDDDF